MGADPLASTNGLVAPIDNGKLVQQDRTPKKAHGEMGKDEFLQLLVAQMQYQDPLQPTDNTQYVSQLATFSSLEQMSNLNQTTMNSQAFMMVGQEIIVKTVTSSGAETYKQGTVDYVRVTGNKAYFSIDGGLYPAQNLYSVVGQGYIASQKVPTVPEANLKYDHDKPEDLEVTVTMGKDEYKASMVAVMINGEVVKSDYLSYKDGEKDGEIVLTIKKDALSKLDAGVHRIGFVFNDVLTTMYSDKVTLTIKGEKPEEPPKPEEPGEEDKEKDSITIK